MIRLSSLQVPKIGIVVLALSAVAPGATAQPAAPPSAETPAPPRKPDTALLEQTVERAKELPNLHSMIVSHDGSVVAEQVFRGPALDRPVNIKSASKTVLSALVGIAIDKGVLKGVDQTVASVLESSIPEDADDRVDEITVGHLLSMRSGLERTSGRNYGAWVSSGNWVRYALSRPMVDEPGGRMLYSTGNTICSRPCSRGPRSAAPSISPATGWAIRWTSTSRLGRATRRASISAATRWRSRPAPSCASARCTGWGA